MPPALSESFNEKYEGGRSGYQSPDARPSSLEDVHSLSSRWQTLWMIEELYGIELEIWSKNRAKLNLDDIREILDAALESEEAVPAVVTELVENDHLEVED